VSRGEEKPMKHRLALIALCLSMSALPAAAQVARVFLSGTGDDLNDCSNVNTPCRSLQGAILQCPAKGEVIIVSSGGYGNAIITKSLTVDTAPGVLAFIARSISVDAAASDTVTLRGLTFNGAVFSDPSGILYNSGGILNVEKCDISGFASAGIDMTASGGSLRVVETGFHDQSYGVYVAPEGVPSKVLVDRCVFERLSVAAMRVYGTGSAAITESVFSNNTDGIEAYAGSGGGDETVTIDRCLFSGTIFYALYSITGNNALATIYVSNSSIESNGLVFGSVTDGTGTASVISFGNNSVKNNQTQGPFTATVPTM
jgi:Right handed beta helix region